MSNLPKVPTVKGIIENLTVDGRKLEKKNIEKVLKLKFGSETMFNLKDREFILEAYEIFSVLGFDEAYDYLRNSQNESSRELIIRNSRLFDGSRKRNFLEITKDLREVKVESHTQCRKCKGFHVNTVSKQVRSLDEGQTDFHSCTDCGHTWSE